MNLQDFRAQYPQYDGVDDDTLMQKLHQKYYSDKLSFDAFKSKFTAGMDQQEAPQPVETPPASEGLWDKTKREVGDIYHDTKAQIAQLGTSALEGPALVSAVGTDTEAPSYSESAAAVAKGEGKILTASGLADVYQGGKEMIGAAANVARRAIQDTFDDGSPVSHYLMWGNKKVATALADSKPVQASQEWTKGVEKEANDALSPAYQASILKNAVDTDEQTGKSSIGEGVTDPNWWVHGGINMGVQLPFTAAAPALAARVVFKDALTTALATAAERKVPQSVALAWAQKKAASEATKAAMIAGGLSEGIISGEQDASQTEDAINQIKEETLLHYKPYVDLRDQGMTHEQARAIVARQKALAVGISSAVVVGLTGAPLNAYIGKWATVGLKAGVAKRLLAGAGMEAGQETVQGAAEQLIQNTEQQDVDPSQGTWDQVLNQAVSGGLIAGVFGGAEGALAGHGKAQEKSPQIRNLRQAETGYKKADAALQATTAAANDPTVSVKYADLVKAREAHLAATINLAQAALATGHLDPNTQATIAGALADAKKHGVEIPAAPDVTTPGEPPGGPPGGGTTSTGEKVALSAEEQAHHDALDAIATAQPVEPTALHALIGAGLAKVSAEGQPVLLPAGRRQRKVLADRLATAAEANAPAEVAPVAREQQSGGKATTVTANTTPAAAPAPAASATTLKAKKRATPKATISAAKAIAALTGGEEPTQDQLDQAEARLKVAEVAGHGEGLGAMRAAFEKAKAAKRAKTIGAPFAPAQEAAAAYMKEAGIEQAPVDTKTPVNPAEGKRVADAYEAMQHNPNDPKVKEAYAAMARETLAQYQHIKKTGLKIEFMKPGQKDPYEGQPRGAIEDVRDNNHLWVYPTEAGYGQGTPEEEALKKDNPMLAPTDEVAGKHKLLVNDVFRVVHDYFGHIQHGNGFRANGEEIAWRSHARMYSPAARAAMTSETRGQNSWVNFGPHGKKNQTASSDNTVYAQQKVGLLPEEFHGNPPDEPPGQGQLISQAAASAAKRKRLLNTQKRMLKFRHFSPVNTPAMTLNPNRMGTGVRGAEAARNGPKVSAFYGENGDIEHEFRGMHEYHANVPADEMYDANADHLGLAAKAQTPVSFTLDDNGKMVPSQSQFDFDKYEELIKKAGYRGYYMPKAKGILRGQARMFDKTAVTNAKNPPEAMAARAKSPAVQMEVDAALKKVAGLLTPQEKVALNRATAKKLVDLFDSLPDEKELAAAAIAGQAKRGWYTQSAKAISNVFGPDAPRFAALLAALSPQTSVQQNLQNAVAVWAAWDKAGRPTDEAAITKLMSESVFPGNNRLNEVGVLPAWIPNTVRALSTETPDTLTLSGPKVDSFAANLRGETNRVTLDSWMANFALVNQTMFSGSLNKSGPGLRPGYLAYTARVRQAAEHLTQMTGETWTPAEVQETVWSWAKTLYEKTSEYGGLGTAQDILNDGEITDALINSTPDFVTQFTDDPIVERTLRAAGYGDRIDELVGQKGTTGNGREKVAPLKGDSARLSRAAGRLDQLRANREAASEAKAGNAMASIAAPRANPQTLTAPFKRWFKNSKVVDARGNPLEVYHGTGSDFDRFHGRETVGWFSEDPELSETYADFASLDDPDNAEQGTGQRIMPAYLSIQNPLSLVGGVDMNQQVFLHELESIVHAVDPKIDLDALYSEWSADDSTRPSAMAYEFLNSRIFFDALEAAGYDGLHVTRRVRRPGQSSTPARSSPPSATMASSIPRWPALRRASPPKPAAIPSRWMRPVSNRCSRQTASRPT